MATLIGSGYDALRHLVVYGQPFTGLTLMFVCRCSVHGQVIIWTMDSAGRTFVSSMVW